MCYPIKVHVVDQSIYLKTCLCLVEMVISFIIEIKPKNEKPIMILRCLDLISLLHGDNLNQFDVE